MAGKKKKNKPAAAAYKLEKRWIANKERRIAKQARIEQKKAEKKFNK